MQFQNKITLSTSNFNEKMILLITWESNNQEHYSKRRMEIAFKGDTHELLEYNLVVGEYVAS